VIIIPDSDDAAVRRRELLERHVALTGSAQARAILANWERYRPRFWKVVPKAALPMAQAAEEEAAEKVAD
jgi:glutamate synthase domain-containing protein 3